MAVTCIACKAFSFKLSGQEWARQGLGHCKHRPHFIRHQAQLERKCEKFETESAETVQARTVWLKNNKETTA